MAESKNTSSGNPVPHDGDHDRVQMPSLHVDGSFAQHNPEFIGDEDSTLEAIKEQYRQQAVSAVDVAERGASTDDLQTALDPSIKELKDKHDAAAAAAEKAAEAQFKKLSS